MMGNLSWFHRAMENNIVNVGWNIGRTSQFVNYDPKLGLEHEIMQT